MRTIARAVGSLVALVALTLMVPVILIAVAGWPLPSAWPDWSQVWLDIRQLNIAYEWVTGALALAAWLLWAQSIWALLFECVNMIRIGRGLVARPAPLTVPAVSLLMSKLVAGVMSASLLAPAPASAGPIDSLQPITTALPDVEDADLIRPPDRPAVAASTSERSVRAPERVTVGDGETAWDVAVRVFGDGNRVGELLDHNDLSVLDVQPGLTLELPPGVSAPSDTVTVVEGDHLWGISTRRLEDVGVHDPSNAQIAAHVDHLVQANQPAIDDPDLIHPGEVFTLPALHAEPNVDQEPSANADAAAAPANADAAAAPVTDADAAAPVGDEPEATSSAGTGPPSNWGAGAPPSSVAGAATADGDAEAGRDDPTDDAESSDSEAIAPGDPGQSDPEPARSDGIDPTDPGGQAQTGLPVGVLAASGIGLVTAAIGAIIARNQAQRLGDRRPGTAPRFSAGGAAEQLIAETADDDALSDLDRALRYLGAKLAADGHRPPDLVGVLVDTGSIRLLIAAPHGGVPEPFSTERDGMVWTTARPFPDVDVQRALNPYPTLTSVGYTDTAELLIDIEYVGSLSLTGGFADVVDAMGTMALQLATSPLADTIEVICVGFGEELADLERITVVPSIDSIGTVVADHADSGAALVEATGSSGPGGRAESVGDWTPMVVFDPLSELDGHPSSLLDAAARSATAGVSAVVNSVASAALTMELSGERLSIPSYGVSVQRRPLTRTERTDLSAAVSGAKRPDHTDRTDLVSALGSVRNHGGPTTEPPPDPAPAAVTEPPAYVVRLLGPLRVEDGHGQTVQFARSATPEFLAYLAHHRDGVEVGRVMNTLWPSTTARRTWIANVYADAARSLESGSSAGVVLNPRPGADDEYRLDPAVTSDLEQFRSMVAQAVALPLTEAVELLTDALAMIEGIPYSNITSRWPIAEGHWQEATVMVDEATRCVATVALDQLDDPHLAEWATARGLLASPHSVELHRLRLRAAIALDGAGDPADGGPSGPSPDAVFQHYQAVIMADDHRPEAASQLDPELVELYESYRRSQPPVARPDPADAIDRRAQGSGVQVPNRR